MRNVSSRISGVACVLVAFLVTGCYAYVRPSVPQPAPGMRIEAELNDTGTVELARLVGPSVVALRGQVLSATAERWTLAVEETLKRSGTDEIWQREPVPVPRPLVSRWTERRFSGLRTAALIGSVVAAAFALTRAIDLVGDEGGSSEKPLPSQ